ncbi:MAG: PQQ-binding-like beta-propeller repeat protein [Pirellulales bacterium]
MTTTHFFGTLQGLWLRLVRGAIAAVVAAVVLAGCGAAENPLPEGYVAGLVTEAKPVAAADWPRYLGPHGNGVSHETGWSAEWPEDGPKQLWSAKIGTGFCSIAVAGGRAYTMGHDDGNDSVFAFDAESGKEIWTHRYECKLVNNLHEGGPAATPTVDGGRVYTCSKEGQVFALDAATGDVVWKAELQTLLDVKMPGWGFSGSPAIVGDMLVIDGGCVVALDKATGELKWKTEAFKPGYGSVTPFERDGETLLAVLNNEFLLVLRAKDGSEVARQEWITSFDTSACTPFVLGDTIFVSTGYGKGCGLFRLAGDTLELVYENKKLRNHMNNSIFHEGHLYGFDGQSNQSRNCNLVCMDYQTGEVRWKEAGLGCGSLIVVDGKLVCLGDKGTLAVAPATPDGFKPMAKAEVLTGKCWTTLALSHGRIYCRNADGDLVCLDVGK